MKLAAFALSLAAATCYAGDLYTHVQAPLVDAYIDSSVDQQPDIPGMGTSLYSVSVSIATQDDATAIFGIYIRVKLADGSQHVCRAEVARGQKVTTYQFLLGESKPVKIMAFNVTRFHQELADQLIRP